MSDAGNAISDFGGAVSDIFGAIGSSEAASAYTKAANIAGTNASLAKTATAITEQQTQMQTYQAIGSEKADTAAAGFKTGEGSADWLLRSSAQQASLAKNLVETQGEITQQGYQQQAEAYEGQASAASTAAEGQGAGGLLKTAAGVASLVGWVICTELMKQGRMDWRWHRAGSAVFARYPAAVKEGYHVWAVHCVRHLRRHPTSMFSALLERVFNWRAENIAAAAGVAGARPLLRGAAVTAALWPACFAIGIVRLALGRLTDWKVLYAED